MFQNILFSELYNTLIKSRIYIQSFLKYPIAILEYVICHMPLDIALTLHFNSKPIKSQTSHGYMGLAPAPAPSLSLSVSVSVALSLWQSPIGTIPWQMQAEQLYTCIKNIHMFICLYICMYVYIDLQKSKSLCIF